jgi:hypothetical protein
MKKAWRSVGALEQHAGGRLFVAAGRPASGSWSSGQVVVHDVADVGLVDAHPERVGGDHDRISLRMKASWLACLRPPAGW